MRLVEDQIYSETALILLRVYNTPWSAYFVTNRRLSATKYYGIIIFVKLLYNIILCNGNYYFSTYFLI